MAGSKTILFAEDDRFISEMYSRVLQKAGYTVDFAYTGSEALKKAQGGKFDLILLDIMMPEKTGIEILEELRGADGKGAPDTKIIILTNLAQNVASQDQLKALADGYLIKADIVPSKLVELINGLW